MGEPLVECLLQVTGDSAALNTFDKRFRSGTGPQWSDRPCDGTPRYSLHALFPVPEEIQRRGYQRALLGELERRFARSHSSKLLVKYSYYFSL